MPPVRKRPQVIDSDEEEEARRGQSSSASPTKRRKTVVQDSQELDDSDLNDLNSGNEKENDDEGLLVDGDGEGGEQLERGRVSFKPEYERGDDGYVAGSVVRIKMTNFMTYDHVEFRPGPHLNMILGPNGTGKSSIAAAIAIGLGFPPKVMGRANELKAYVKQGADQAMVEIELKGKRGKRNTVIWRKFNKEDEKSEWKYNGSTCTRREVLEYVQRFGIQANNLCSFLPQDKVAEFAKMAPEVVLKETMRAAGDPRLTNWHEMLVEKGAKSKEIGNTLEGHVNVRDRLKAQVDALAPDVEHVQEREAREMEAEILEHVVAVSQHAELKKAVDQAKKEKETVAARYTKLQGRRQPLKELKEYWEKKAHKDEVKAQSVESKYKDGMKDLRTKLNKARDVGDKSADIDRQLERLKVTFKRRQDERESLIRRIEECQKILDEPREEVDSEVRAKSREKADLQTEYRRKEGVLDELKDEYEDNKRMFRELNQEIEDLNKKQMMLQNINAQKERAARDLDPSIDFMLDWLDKNGHTLEGPVHKPPMISVTVQNKDYAWQVEQCTNLKQRSTFICTAQADFDRLLALNNTQYPSRIVQGRRFEGGKVQLNLAYQDVTNESVNPRRPCDAERLQELGMDGFAIDYVDAEPAVIAYLCKQSGLHATALTQRPSVQVDGNALTALGIKAWATRDDHTTAIQSAYGRRDHVHRTNQKQEARAFNRTVDNQAVQRIVEEIARKKKTKYDREQPHSELKARLDGITDEREDIKRQAGVLEKEIKALQEKAKRWQRAATDCEQHKEKLRKLEAQPSQEEERKKLKAEKLKFAKARLRPLDAWLDSCDFVSENCSDIVTSALTALQSTINKQAVSSRLNEGNEMLNRAKKDLEDAGVRVDEARRRAANKWQQLTTAIQDSPNEIKEEVRNRARDVSSLPPLEELQGQLQTLRAQLELAVNIPGNVVARYNDYKDKLDKAQDIVDREELELNGLKRDIKKTLDMFDPALETLVQAVSAKFSAAFARVKCSGEVRIRRVEGDFSAWGIEILVSYRDEDSLAILTGSHQSGGERSLATVTYLMSLSEMSRTPFSLVDEINQGMDQRAERAVHNQLVEVTCDADAGQYFLITPKLLTGLTYHPKMKVLIINNGAHLPDSRMQSQRYGDLSACLKKYSKKHSIAAH
ncbi:hypothetical protein I302_106545 [Kwoniella bestiolae CBS 10118]|uniref:Structural maintenance of chromosomes protein 5 n=1 Tax=Kwoniella bestiolae CBS 10118 TaxID=1296100 RepID=A0A1B9G130_9TREE|nr:hypothetical protein I302_06193 [Kwoniella bestiolae CBS 10118]OCF24732.1 hypothetical protein I302_06193 [Kwoniella bestiolae CBS 10118]